jgi:hypothetical protein
MRTKVKCEGCGRTLSEKEYKYWSFQLFKDEAVKYGDKPEIWLCRDCQKNEQLIRKMKGK